MNPIRELKMYVAIWVVLVLALVVAAADAARQAQHKQSGWRRHRGHTIGS